MKDFEGVVKPRTKQKEFDNFGTLSLLPPRHRQTVFSQTATVLDVSQFSEHAKGTAVKSVVDEDDASDDINDNIHDCDNSLVTPQKKDSDSVSLFRLHIEIDELFSLEISEKNRSKSMIAILCQSLYSDEMICYRQTYLTFTLYSRTS